MIGPAAMNDRRPDTIIDSGDEFAAAPLSTHMPFPATARVMKLVRTDWIYFLFRHPLVTFILLGVFFLLFGTTSINLFFLLKANLNLFLEYGLMVIDDGALEQLVELLGSAYLSMLFWILFRLCERVLIERLTKKRFGAKWANRE
jgi:hypothetical protein